MSEVSLPPHLQEVLETMSAEMGVPSDALLAQAVFMLARLNGYVVPGKVSGGGGAQARPATGGRPAANNRRRAEPEPEEEEGNPFDQQEEEPPPEEPPAEEEPQEEEPPPEEEPQEEPPPPRGRSSGPAVTLTMAGRDPFKMSGDAVLIGRGKHCDFVIESNRVSREHARITKKGADLLLEDLGSSNGTFVGASKEKVTSPRKLKDGDDLTFGTEKVKISIRR